MLCLRGMDTVKVSKVNGHAVQAMVDNGDVRSEDLVGNKGADTAADLGRLRQQDDVITGRRDFLRVRRHWYPIKLDLHKFMVAISRIEVNHDGSGGTAPDAVVWDHGRLVKSRASSLRIVVDHASLPGPPGFFGLLLVQHPFDPHYSGGCSCLPYILLEFTSFLASLEPTGFCPVIRVKYARVPVRLQFVSLPEPPPWRSC